jgi:hypothetical protein
MKKDREKLEDALNLVLQDYSNDSKTINNVTNSLMEKGFARGRVGGIFSQSIPLSYISQTELCLFTKHLYSNTHEYKINPETFFNELELVQADQYSGIEKEKTNHIILHNVDQIGEYQWLCTIEPYININKHFQNGLLSYNPRTQRQPLKRKVGDRIIETINIDPIKINEICELMLDGNFDTNAIVWNIQKTGLEKFKYNKNDRTLTIFDGTYTAILDGFHRCGAMLKAIDQKPDLNRVTSIFIYNVDEDKARSIIRRESKSTPITEEFLNLMDISDQNMEAIKGLNSKQRLNEMFNRIGLDHSELKSNRENKLVTFDTLSKTVEYIYDLKDKPVLEVQNVQKQLIDIFNIVIGTYHTSFNENLAETKETSYLASNNTFIGYLALGAELTSKYPDSWQEELQTILKSLDFSKSGSTVDWKKVGLENNINLSTIKRISEYFKTLT